MSSIDDEIFNDDNLDEYYIESDKNQSSKKQSIVNVTSTSGLIYTNNVNIYNIPKEQIDDINTVYQSWNAYLKKRQWDSKLSDGHILRLNEMTRQVTLVAWLCHLKFLSDLCDHPLTKAAVLSLYYLNEADKTPRFLFEFICKNFYISKDYDIWCMDSVTTRYIKGAILLKIFRSIYFRKAPVIIATLIFVTLCRAFGYFCRFILDIPKTYIDNKKPVNAFSQVYDPTTQSWTMANFKYLSFGDYIFEGIKTPLNSNLYDNVPYTNTENPIAKLVYNNKIFIFKPEKIFIYTMDFRVIYAIFSPKAHRLTNLRIPNRFINALYYTLDQYDISSNFLSNKSESTIQAYIKYNNKDSIKGLYIISCCNYGYFYDLTMCFHNKWYNVIKKRKQKFHKWLSDLITNLQLKCLTGEKIGRYKTHIKFLHQLDDNMLNNKLNDIKNVKSWIQNHPIFILESQLGSRQAISPTAKVAGIFQNERIYYRKDVLQLKTKMGWHREMRRIKPDQNPLKTIEIKKKLSHRFFNKGLLGLTTITLELYSIDQTEVELVKSFTDSINSFGNIDLTGNRTVPIDSLHISGSHQDIITLAANHCKISHTPALVSFTYDIDIKPLINGIVINVNDKIKFLDSYLYLLNNTNKNKKDPNLDYWKICFKTLSRYKSKPKHISGNKLAKLINANIIIN